MRQETRGLISTERRLRAFEPRLPEIRAIRSGQSRRWVWPVIYQPYSEGAAFFVKKPLTYGKALKLPRYLWPKTGKLGWAYSLVTPKRRTRALNWATKNFFRVVEA